MDRRSNMIGYKTTWLLGLKRNGLWAKAGSQDTSYKTIEIIQAKNNNNKVRWSVKTP